MLLLNSQFWRHKILNYPAKLKLRNTWLNHEIGCHKSMRLYQRSHMILPSFVLQQMYQDPVRYNCKIKISPPTLGRNLRNSVMNMEKLSPKTNEDIGRTKLVKMDIDMRDSPPVSSRPYTLPLKHYEWVQRERSLERAGVITKSMSKWASPIVIVPKKSAPGEPQKRKLCVDFRKVSELQQEVITAGKTRGQISIHSLLKIDEMYAKLKGAKVFSTNDLRSGYHHIALGKSSELRPHLLCHLVSINSSWFHLG